MPHDGAEAVGLDGLHLTTSVPYIPSSSWLESAQKNRYSPLRTRATFVARSPGRRLETFATRPSREPEGVGGRPAAVAAQPPADRSAAGDSGSRRARRPRGRRARAPPARRRRRPGAPRREGRAGAGGGGGASWKAAIVPYALPPHAPPPAALALPVVAAAAVACGSEEVQVAKTSPDYAGAEIFHQRCGGCHSLKAAGTQGSAVKANKREYKDGPNFDQRKEQHDQILYAIRNGGFSSGPMPQDIVVGKQAEQVARFIEKNSGQGRRRRPSLPSAAPMLDLKAIRRDPDGRARGARAARRRLRRAAGRGAGARRAAARAAAGGRGAARAPERGLAGDRARQEGGRGRRRRDRRDAGGLAPGQDADRGARRGRGGARRRRSARCRTRPTRRRPTRTRRCARWGSRSCRSTRRATISTSPAS